MTGLLSTELLPWHTEQWEHFCQLRSTDKLAHAYLFQGQQGLGKESLARHLGHYLLCEAPIENKPCGQCQPCQLNSAGTHPDLVILKPEESKNIKIEQVRDAVEFMSKTSQQGGRKIIIVSPVEAMNINSANALLKILEEPAESSLLLLISHHPGLLLATIKSRCQSIKFVRPSEEAACHWLDSQNVSSSASTMLRLANGAPLKALALADEDATHERNILHESINQLLLRKINAVQAAEKCAKFEIKDNIDGMMLCITDILRFKQSEQSFKLRDPDLLALSNILFQHDAVSLHGLLTEIIKARKAAISNTNPNVQLILESLFIAWANITNPAELSMQNMAPQWK